MGQSSKLVIFLGFLLLSQSAYAGQRFNNIIGGKDYCVTIQEEDASPASVACGILKVPNGNLTDNGDGTFSLADNTSVGGGNNVFLEHDASAEGDNSASDITIDATTGLDLTCVGQDCTLLAEAASDTNVGSVELATTAETTTGSSTTLAVTPGGLEAGFDGSTAIVTVGTVTTGTWSATDVAVDSGGTGASSLTDGGVLLGSGTGAITPMAVLADGAIVVGDGTTDPVALTAFTSSTGDVIHEAGGLEADVSGYTNGLYGQIAGATADVDTESELETALGSVDVVVVATDDISSANAATLISDETGTGNVVFSASPTFTGTIVAASIDASGVVSGTVIVAEAELNIPHSATPPSTCAEGDIYMDTNATTGQRLYGCESGVFVQQGGSGGGDSVSVDGAGVVDPNFASTGQIDFVDTSNTVTANINDNSILEADLKAVDAAADEDILTFETTTGDFEWHSGPDLCAAITGSAALCDGDDATGAGSGAFSDASDPVVLNTTTKDVHIGDGAGTLTGKLEIGGDADQPQLVIEGHSTQTDALLILQTDADAEVFGVTAAGVVESVAGAFDGEHIQDDTIDDDSIDFADIEDDLESLLDIDGEVSSTGMGSTVLDETGISLTSITIGALLGVDSIDATGAVDMDYGSADVTDHTFIADGGTAIIDGSFQFPDADGSPAAAGELQYDNTVTGLLDGALAWYDDDAVRYLVDLATLPSDDDYVVAYDATADGFYMKADAEGSGSIPSDPGADALLAWDDSDTGTETQWIAIGTGLSFDGSTLTATGGGGGATNLNLPVYSAKLTGAFVVFTPPTADACTQGAQIDAGDGNWRLLFDATTDECATWQFIMPSNYASAPIINVDFSMTSGEANEVEFESAIMCYTPTTDTADIGTASFSNVAVGTATTVSATAGEVYRQSITLTDDSCAANDIVFVVITPDADDATNDDATGDREVVGVSLSYTGS